MREGDKLDNNKKGRDQRLSSKTRGCLGLTITTSMTAIALLTEKKLEGEVWMNMNTHEVSTQRLIA